MVAASHFPLRVSSEAKQATRRTESLRWWNIHGRALGSPPSLLPVLERACASVSTPEVPAVGWLRSNFLCGLGYGDPAKLHPRGPRLGFDEACRLL
jgi:hypothetical protein